MFNKSARYPDVETVNVQKTARHVAVFCYSNGGVHLREVEVYSICKLEYPKVSS